MDRGVLILAGMFGAGFLMLVGAGMHSTPERTCPQAALRGLMPNPIKGPVRMLPEIIR